MKVEYKNGKKQKVLEVGDDNLRLAEDTGGGTGAYTSRANLGLFGCGSIWLPLPVLAIPSTLLRPAATYLAVDLDLAVDLSPQRNDIDPQRIRSPPPHSFGKLCMCSLAPRSR